jgi:hypothetical protein
MSTAKQGGEELNSPAEFRRLVHVSRAVAISQS